MKLVKTLAVSALAVCGTLAFTAAPAQAQATRTWVSGVGDDVNPCSRTAPCKTFAGAISKTAAGGEINCLDPAGFGAVTITKSMTIDCTGTLGGILASSTTGVIINGAGAIVTLRALEINGGPPNLPGVNGVRFLQGTRLSIEDSTIYNFLGAQPNGFGIIINNTSTTVQLNVRNTVIRNNGTATSGGGIGILPTGSGAANVTLDNVQITGHFRGIEISTVGNTGPGSQVMMDEVVISSGNNGIAVNVPAGTSAVNVLVQDSELANLSGTALAASGSANANIRVADSTITLNGTGVSAVGGSNIQSFGNNRLLNNTSNGAFTGVLLDES